MPRVLALRIDVMQPPRMRDFAKNGFEERALARAVRPDERRQLAAVDVEVHVLEDGEPPGLYAEILDFRAAELRAILTRSRAMMQNGLEQKKPP